MAEAAVTYSLTSSREAEIAIFKEFYETNLVPNEWIRGNHIEFDAAINSIIQALATDSADHCLFKDYPAPTAAQMCQYFEQLVNLGLKLKLEPANARLQFKDDRKISEEDRENEEKEIKELNEALLIMEPFLAFLPAIFDAAFSQQPAFPGVSAAQLTGMHIVLARAMTYCYLSSSAWVGLGEKKEKKDKRKLRDEKLERCVASRILSFKSQGATVPLKEGIVSLEAQTPDWSFVKGCFEDDQYALAGAVYVEFLGNAQITENYLFGRDVSLVQLISDAAVRKGMVSQMLTCYITYQDTMAANLPGHPEKLEDLHARGQDIVPVFLEFASSTTFRNVQRPHFDKFLVFWERWEMEEPAQES